MSEILCPQCKSPNRDTARYCSECGAPLLAGIPAPSAPAQAPASNPQPQLPSAPAGPATAPPPEAPPIILLGRYRLEHELGKGGFGAVYQAFDLNLSHPCAVKENLDASAEAQRQFAREASVLANLSHPNLPRVTDHFSIPGQGQYLVMDFVEGEDLAHVSDRVGTLPVSQAVEWISQVAEALDYLHSRTPPVLHRDIKPANIRITPEDKAMLVDFGLVKVSDPLLKTTLGARAVTPGYAPPEQYGLGRTGPRTDIYALSATLYRLLSGQEPMESVQRAAGGRLPQVNELNPGVPLPLSQAIEQGMALDPARRFANAAEFRHAIRQAAGLPLSDPHSQEAVQVLRSPVAATLVVEDAAPARALPAAPAQPRTSLPRSAASSPPAKRSPLMWVGAGAAVLAVCLCAALGLFVFWGRDASSTLAVQVSPTFGTNGGVIANDTPTPAPATPPPASPPPPSDAWRSPDPNTMIYVTGGSPSTLDPAHDYETNGLTVVQNIYDTLIFFDRDNADRFIPQLALEVPSPENGGISPDGLTYTFKIRPDVHFHNGALLTAEDVAFTFQRNLLQGGINSPQWLLAEPLLGIGVYDVSSLVGAQYEANRDELKKAPAAALQQVCQQVTRAITFDAGQGTVTFHLKQRWGPFLGTLANAWGSIQSKGWLIDNGAWNGDCTTWQNFYGPTSGELNKTGLGKQANGTGPYQLEYWNDQEVALVANSNYWRREAAWPDGPSGAPRIQKIIIRFIPGFSERLETLKKGEADFMRLGSSPDIGALDALTGLDCARYDTDCAPTANPDGRLMRVRGFALGERNNDLFFNFSINTESSVLGSGKLDGNGIPSNFFANAHVRRGFASCFDYDRFLKEVMGGEGLRAITVMPPNMLGYNAATPYYTYNSKRCEDELRQAIFDDKNVWDTGFTLSLPAEEPNRGSMMIATIWQDELNAINPKFNVSVQALPSDDFDKLSRDGSLPYYILGWVEDIHDPHNWAYPYVVGNLGSNQQMPPEFLAPFRDLLRASVESNDPAMRNDVYQKFNQLYYEQAPSIPMFQGIGRQYLQRWVSGFYGNPVLPGPYFYAFSKR